MEPGAGDSVEPKEQPHGGALLQPWQKGISPNPGGKPKSEKGFRRRSREITLDMLPGIEKLNAHLLEMALASKDSEEVIALTTRLEGNFRMLAAQGFGNVPERVVIEDDSAVAREAMPALIGKFMQELERRERESSIRERTVEALPPPEGNG